MPASIVRLDVSEILLDGGFHVRCDLHISSP
jgi:hypothetical protein